MKTRAGGTVRRSQQSKVGLYVSYLGWTRRNSGAFAREITRKHVKSPAQYAGRGFLLVRYAKYVHSLGKQVIRTICALVHILIPVRKRWFN